MEINYIYTISCPFTSLVRYVGKTKNPTERFRKHLTARNKSYSSKWIRGTIEKGLKPVFEIIDECGEEWQEKEKQYILLFKSLGAQLLNMMPGGEGGPTMLGRTLTPEQRAKIAASKIGKPNKGAAEWAKLNKGLKVARYDLQGTFIDSFNSIKEAARAVGRDDRRIQAMVNNQLVRNRKVQSVGGFVFRLL